jgi:hypothetical protein
MSTWKIDQVTSSKDNGLVVKIHWRVLLSDGAFHASDFGVVDVERSQSFIGYAELTEEIILGWVYDKLGANKVSMIENALSEKINSQKNQGVVNGLPWISSQI